MGPMQAQMSEDLRAHCDTVHTQGGTADATPGSRSRGAPAMSWPPSGGHTGGELRPPGSPDRQAGQCGEILLHLGDDTGAADLDEHLGPSSSVARGPARWTLRRAAEDRRW